MPWDRQTDGSRYRLMPPRRQWRRNYGDRWVHCTPQVQDLYPLYPPSQRCGFRQNLKQTTLTTRLYKVRTNLYPLLTKTFRHDCSVGCIITPLRLTVAASKTLRRRHFRHQRSSTSPAPHGPMVDSLHCSMTTLSHTLPVNHNTLLLLTQTHTHTHPFNGPLSGTTRVSRYQKSKTDLDFTEARDSEWQWHQRGHMKVCTSLQTDNHASTPTLSFFYRPDALPAAHQQCQSTEGKSTEGCCY